MSYCIYAIIDPTINQIFYIGHTSNLSRRRRQHIKGNLDLASRRTKKLLDQKLYVPFLTLETCKTRTQAIHARTFWIELMHTRGIRLMNKKSSTRNT